MVGPRGDVSAIYLPASYYISDFAGFYLSHNQDETFSLFLGGFLILLFSQTAVQLGRGPYLKD